MFGGNEVVDRWKDQSGNSNDFIQSNSTKKPSYEYEDTTNGYPYLSFDGTDDFMQCVNNSIDGTTDSLDNAISIFYIAKANDAAGGNLLSLNKENASFPNASVIARVADSSTVNWMNQLEDSGDDVSTHTYATNTLNTTGVYGFTLKTNGQMKSYYNGALVDTENNAGFNPQPYTNTYPIMLGAARSVAPTDFLNAQVQEIMIFDKELTTDEALHLSKYLQHKYDI